MGKDHGVRKSPGNPGGGAAEKMGGSKMERGHPLPQKGNEQATPWGGPRNEPLFEKRVLEGKKKIPVGVERVQDRGASPWERIDRRGKPEIFKWGDRMNPVGTVSNTWKKRGRLGV